MKLLKYKVNKFRSVKETEWINIDDLACFVGINESGKTNLLLPLWKFNPSDDSIKIDLLLDYPRNEYLGFENNKERYHNEHFIEVLFKLEDQEIKEFNELHKKLSSNKSLIESSNLCEENESKNDFSEFLLIKKTYNEKFDI
jgi:predicted ATP-dependent endonuclease of OLD family